MTIRLKRRPENFAGMLKSKITVNGEYVGKIANGEEKELTIPEDNTILQIKQVNGKSNKLVVNKGDVIEISNGRSVMWVFLIAFMFMLITSNLEGATWVVGLVLSAILIFCLLLVIDTFKLTKVGRD